MQLAAAGLALLAVLLAGCQGSSAPPPRAASSAASTPAATGPGEQAALAAAGGDFARAATLYRQGLEQGADRLALHYGLGVAASHLDRRAEAIREFRWVADHADQGSEEARVARRWLKSVGADAGAEDARAPEPSAAVATQAQAATATVHGRIASGDVPSVDRKMLFFFDHPNRLIYQRIRTDAHGNFQFAPVPPGTYMLTDRIAGVPMWRLRVDLRPGQDVALDLTPVNSTRQRDDFPGAF